MLISRTFQHSASWFNMLYYAILLFSLSSVAEGSTLSYSTIVLLPTPSVKTPSTKNPEFGNHNVTTKGLHDMGSISSTISQTTPAGNLLLKTFKSYGFQTSSIVSRSQDQEQNSIIHTIQLSLSNSQTITNNGESPKISRELPRPSHVVTENHRTSTIGSVNSFQIHLIKNKNSSNSESPNRTVTKMSSCENDEKNCHGYVTRWVDFYLNVGGWIMLAVVLLGIISLLVTHILGRRSANHSEITGLRGREVHGRYRAHWI